MAWDKVEATKPPESSFFKPASEVAITRGLKVGVWGPPESGKSYFGQSFPEPVYVIDTEFAAAKIARQHFPNKKIYIFEATVIDKKTDQPDPVGSLKQIEDAIISLKNLTSGTIVVDTVTDYWSFMSAYVESTASRKTQTGQPFRFEWGTANERYKYFILRLLSYPVHVVLIAQPKRLYGSKGEELPDTAPSWMKQTPHWVDIQLAFQKQFISGAMKYYAVIEKCRFQRAYHATIEDCTYDKLVAKLKQLGVTIV